MKKRLLAIFGIIVLFILGFLVASHFFVKDKSDTGLRPESYLPENANSIENTGENCDINFSEYFVEPTYVQKVGQIGVVHGSGLYIVERSYVSVKEEFTGKKVPIYAPIDMILASGSHYQNPAAPANALPDYALWFDVGCDVEVNFAHLKEVVEPIAVQLPDIKVDSRSTRLNRMKFNAGDLIGYFVYTQNDVAGFDFIVRDRKVVNQFINQERYSGDRASNLINGVCPYDFYTGEKKEAYYNLFGGGGGTIFNVKDCGTASRDKVGTLSGMWFLDKEVTGSIYDTYEEGDYGSTLSIVGDEERVSIGNLGQSNTLGVYANNPTYKMPTEITTEHCYQIYSTPSDADGYAYFKVVNDVTLDVNYAASGKCPSVFPSGGKRYYK